MEEAEEKSRGFKVEDRRRFSPEGESRVGVDNSTETQSAGVENAQGEGRSAVERREERGGSASAADAVTFSGFLLGLSTQAIIHLGEMPDPVTGETNRNLEAARQLIDLLGVIKEKTRGNLDKAEQGMIDEILFDLRMRYVELAKPSGV
jgi:hypothetical protein